MKRYLLFFLILSPCMAQERLMPSRAQHDSLVKRKSKIALLAHKMEELQAEQVYAISELQAEIKKVILDNRWPADTQIDYPTLAFYLRATSVPSPAPPPIPPVQQPVIAPPPPKP